MLLNCSSLQKIAVVCLIILLTSCTQQQTSKTHLSQVRDSLENSHNQLISENEHTKSKRKLNLDELYQQALTPRSAVQIFIAQSPRVQEALSQLQEADAQELQASLIGNPHLSFSLLKPSDGKHWLWDANLMQPFFDLLTRSARKQLAAQEALQIELDVLDQLNQLIADFQVDYFKAVSLQQSLAIAKNKLEARDARASLAKAIYQAGNISELEYLDHLTEFQKEQLSSSELSFEKMLATQRLNYWFASDKSFKLPTEFPEIPNELWDLDQLKKIAFQQNAELKLLRLKLQLFSDQVNLVKKEYGLSNIELGIAAKQEADGSKALGVATDIPLSIFDQGKAKLIALQARSHAATAKQKEFELLLGYKIYESLMRMQIAKDNIQHLEKSAETAERRLELAQQQMNFMLKSPFELIDLKYDLLNIKLESSKTQLIYWEAYSQLEALVGKSLIVDTSTSTTEPEKK